MMDTTVLLGRGLLEHDSIERHTDRWGAVHLIDAAGRARRIERGHADPTGRITFDHAPVGHVGDLVAVVIDDHNKPRPNRRPFGPPIIAPLEAVDAPAESCGDVGRNAVVHTLISSSSCPGDSGASNSASATTT